MKSTVLFLAAALSALAGCDRAGHEAHAHGERCSRAAEDAHDGHDAHDEHETCEGEAAPAAVTVSEDAQRLLGLTTVRAERRRLAATRAFAGRYELSPDARRTVAAGVGGRLVHLVRPLARVSAGDALFSVFSPDLVARAKEIDTLEKRLAVYRSLDTPNAELENELAVKRAERAALLGDAVEKDGVVTVRAPCDGLVESFEADAGAWLEPGAAAVRIADPRRLFFRAYAAAADVRGLEDGLPATVGAHAGELRLGVGDASGLVPVSVVFPDRLPEHAGARAEAVCTVASNETPRTAVPSACLVSVGLQPTVFVRDPADATRFFARPVATGLAGGGWTAVDGVPEGAEVVRDGVYELKLALPSGEARPAGHFHADGAFHEDEH